MRVLYLSLCIILADQCTKLLVKEGWTIPLLGLQVGGFQLKSSRPLLGDWLRLTYIENPGMAFGIDLGGKLFFSLLSLAAVAVVLWYLYRMRTEPLGVRCALAAILGGAAGNLVDRVFYGVAFGEGPLFHGRVVDFLDMEFPDISLGFIQMERWPVFNIADASVTVGVILLLFLYRSPRPEELSASGPAA
ncbi:MAG: signal peptidase II [Bacteroidota bacterium]